MALTTADKNWITAQMNAAAASADEVKALLTVFSDDFLTLKIGDKASPNRTVGDVLRDVAKWRGYEVGDKADTANAAIPEGSPLARKTAAADKILTP